MKYTTNQSAQKGITLIELFAALAVLAVILSFASGPFERMSARIEVDVAKDNVIKALLAAQNAAVRNQLPVNVRFTEEQDMMRLEAKFTQRRSSFMLQNLPVYILPENITVTHDLGLTGMTFSPEGFPALDGLIRLSSKKNPGYFVEIPIADPG